MKGGGGGGAESVKCRTSLATNNKRGGGIDVRQ